MNYTSSHTLLSAPTVSTTGTALDVSRVKAWNAQVICTGNSGTAVTVVVQASIDGTTYAQVDSTTLTSSNTGYFVGKSFTPYQSIKAYTHTQATEATVTVNCRLLS